MASKPQTPETSANDPIIDDIPAGLTPVRNVTVPTLKFPDGSRIAVKIISKIEKGKEMKEGRGGKPKMEPADVAQVMRLSTGEVVQLIFGTVLKSEIEDAYPEHSYVGKCFVIEKHAKAVGKTYATYSVTEVADPTGN